LQHLTAEDKRVCYKLCCDVLSKPEDDELFAVKTEFSDEATFHPSWYVNGYNIRLLGDNSPYSVILATNNGQSQVQCPLCSIHIKRFEENCGIKKKA